MTKVLQLRSRQAMDEVKSGPFYVAQFHQASRSLLAITQNREVAMYSWVDAGRMKGFMLDRRNAVRPHSFNPLELFCSQRDGVFIACGNEVGRGLVTVITLDLEQIPVVQLSVGGKIKAACYNNEQRELIVALSTGVLKLYSFRVLKNRATGKASYRLPLRLTIEMKTKHNFLTEVCIDEKSGILYGASKQHIFAFDIQQGLLLGHLRTLPTGTEISTMVCDNDGEKLVALISHDRNGRWRTTIWQISDADPHNGQRSIERQLQIDFVRPLVNIQFMYHESETLLYIFDADMVMYIWRLLGGQMEQVTAYQFSSMVGLNVALPATNKKMPSNRCALPHSPPINSNSSSEGKDLVQRKVAFVLPGLPATDFKVDMIAYVGQQICAFRIISRMIWDTKAAFESSVIKISASSAQSTGEVMALCGDASVSYFSSDPSKSAAVLTPKTIHLSCEKLSREVTRLGGAEQMTETDIAPLCMHYDPLSKRLVLGWTNGRVDVRDMPCGTEIHNLTDALASPATCVTCFAPSEGIHDAWFAISGHADGRLKVWEIGVKDHRVAFTLPKHDSSVITLEIFTWGGTRSPYLLSVCRGGDVKVWRIEGETGDGAVTEPRWRLSAYFHGGNSRCAHMSVSCLICGNLVGMGFNTGLVQLWELPFFDASAPALLATRKVPLHQAAHHSKGVLAICAVEGTRQLHLGSGGLHLSLFSSAKDATVIRWEILHGCLRPLQRISFSTEIAHLRVVQRDTMFELLGSLAGFVAVLERFPTHELFDSDAKMHLDDIEGFREQPGPVHDFHETANIPFEAVAVCARGSLSTGTFNHSIDGDMTETVVLGGKVPTEPVVLREGKHVNGNSVNSVSSGGSQAIYSTCDTAEQPRVIPKTSKFGNCFETQLPKVHGIPRQELRTSKHCFGEQIVESREINKKYPLIVTISQPRSQSRPPSAMELLQETEIDEIGNKCGLFRSTSAPVGVRSTSTPFAREVEVTVPMQPAVDIKPMFDFAEDQLIISPDNRSSAPENWTPLSRLRSSGYADSPRQNGIARSKLHSAQSSRLKGRTRKRFFIDQCLAVSTSLDSVGSGLPTGYSENKKKEDQKRFMIQRPTPRHNQRERDRKVSREAAPLNVIQLVSSNGDMAIKRKPPYFEGTELSDGYNEDIADPRDISKGAFPSADGVRSRGSDNAKSCGAQDMYEDGTDNLGLVASMSLEDRSVANELNALAAMTGGAVKEMEWAQLLEYAPLRNGLSTGALTEDDAKAIFLGICERIDSSVSMSQYKVFTQQIRDLLSRRYAPPIITRDIVDIDHETITVLVHTNCPASVWFTVSLSGGTRTGEDVRSGANCVLAKVLELTAEGALEAWVTIPDLMPETTYSLHFYGEHPLSETGGPSRNTDEDVVQSSLEVTTDEAPPAMEIPWDSLSLAMQEVEVMAAIKDKGVRKAARDMGVELPKNDDSTSLEDEASDRWNNFVDWWSDGVLDSQVSSAGNVNEIRNAFLRREMVFAASNKEIRRSAETSGVVLEDGDWDVRWLTGATEEAKLKVKRWSYFCYWYSGIPIPKRKKNKKIKKLRLLMPAGPSDQSCAAHGDVVGRGPLQGDTPGRRDERNDMIGAIGDRAASTMPMDSSAVASVSIRDTNASVPLDMPMLPAASSEHAKAGHSLLGSTEQLSVDSDDADEEDAPVPIVNPKVRMAARTKLLKSRSKKVTSLAAKLATMKGPSRVKQIGGKFSLKDMGKGIMAANKMAFLSKSAAKPPSEEDLSIFEDLNEEMMLPTNEPEDSKAVLQPDADFVVSWNSMPPQERQLEAMMACMNPDVVLLAIMDGISAPDVEDWSVDVVGRRKKVDLFEKWYGGYAVSRPRESAMMVEATLARKYDPVCAAAQEASVFCDSEAAPGDTFGRWYAQQKELRAAVLQLRANSIVESRRMAISALFGWGEVLAPFQFVPPLCTSSNVPKSSHRIRAFPTRSAELFSADEMKAWYAEDVYFAEDAALQTAEQHGHKAIAHDQCKQFEEVQQSMEGDIMTWEDRRADMLREVEKEIGVNFVSAATLVGTYEFYRSFQNLEFNNLPALVYDNGSGLENGDEISDQAEEAKRAAEIVAKDRAEERKWRLEAKRKAKEEERRKAEEEEKFLRADRTQREREQIIAYLAELKLKKVADANVKQREAEAEAHMQQVTEANIKSALAQAAIARREKELFDIETALAEKRAKAREESLAQAAEHDAMLCEDMESEAFRHAVHDFEEKFIENASIIRSLYTPHELYFPPPRNEDMKYALQNISVAPQRCQVESFAVPYAQAILDDVDQNKYTCETMSDKYANLLGLRKVVTFRSTNSPEHLISGIRAARTYGISDLADSHLTSMPLNSRPSTSLGHGHLRRPLSRGMGQPERAPRTSRPATHESTRSSVSGYSKGRRGPAKKTRALTAIRPESRFETHSRTQPVMGIDGSSASASLPKRGGAGASI